MHVPRRAVYDQGWSGRNGRSLPTQLRIERLADKVFDDGTTRRGYGHQQPTRGLFMIDCNHKSEVGSVKLLFSTFSDSISWLEVADDLYGVKGVYDFICLSSVI